MKDRGPIEITIDGVKRYHLRIGFFSKMYLMDYSFPTPIREERELIILKKAWDYGERKFKIISGNFNIKKPTKKLAMIGISRKGERGFTIKVAE